MAKSKTRRVVFQPATYQGIQKGIDQIVNAIRPTLGPQPRFVAIGDIVDSNKMPEMLDNGGVIARRIIELHKGTITAESRTGMGTRFTISLPAIS